MEAMDAMSNAQRKLLASERENLILQNLAAGICTITEMSLHLGVSEATVRRDLQNLELQGKARRVHGGAEMVKHFHTEPFFAEKTAVQTQEKEHIAALALEYIHDNDSIFLDGGSTVLALARKLNARKNLTVVTNSLMAASELMESDHRLILLGGEFRALSRTLVGPLTEKVLSSLVIGKAFLGTMGLTLDGGISTSDPNEAYTKELVMKHAKLTLVLCDSSKLGTASFSASGSWSDIDVLITDGGIPEKFLKALQKKAVEVSF